MLIEYLKSISYAHDISLKWELKVVVGYATNLSGTTIS
ncbi:hypothetical protein EMIT0P12_30367 [Pseudomonas sp. IT-P12]